MNTKNLFVPLFLIFSIFVITGCKKDNYKNAAKKIVYFKGKTLVCKGKIVNRYNSKIMNDNVYQNGKLISNLSDCKTRK